MTWAAASSWTSQIQTRQQTPAGRGPRPAERQADVDAQRGYGPAGGVADLVGAAPRQAHQQPEPQQLGGPAHLWMVKAATEACPWFPCSVLTTALTILDRSLTSPPSEESTRSRIATES